MDVVTRYDLALLVLFAIFISIFLYSKRSNLKKEGLLFLYKTSWGIKLIERVGNRYQKTLKFLGYISITLGYFLMATMLYLFVKIIYLYVAYPAIVREIKIPPIMPLIPYLPGIFKLDFLPEFYFTYWIIILAVIAITHEFAHGIFAALNKVRIKTTGFGFFPYFLPVFLAAFVELDEEEMAKKKKIPQMAILSAGTFANTITAILFFFIIWLFFIGTFVPTGVVFNDYSYSVIAISSITSINNNLLNNPTYEDVVALAGNRSLNEIKVGERVYVGIKAMDNNLEKIALYDDSPAINNNLTGAIMEINNVKIDSVEKLGEELKKYSPGQEITMKINDGTGIKEQKITLGENPEDKTKPWIGIGFQIQEKSGIIGNVYGMLSSFKNPNIYYESKWGNFGLFIYNLLWWLVLISISVALVNMLPVGIFDGGRFFYLTIWGITKSEKKANYAYKFMTYFFLFLLFVLMLFWALSFTNIL